MAKTMTKKEKFAAIINFIEGRESALSPVEMVEALSYEIELLEKKASTPRKPTANQIENEALSAEILSYLIAEDTTKSIKDLQTEMPSLAPLSNQRISHILTALVNAGQLTKSYIKKVPYYCAK